MIIYEKIRFKLTIALVDFGNETTIWLKDDLQIFENFRLTKALKKILTTKLTKYTWCRYDSILSVFYNTNYCWGAKIR